MLKEALRKAINDHACFMSSSDNARGVALVMTDLKPHEIEALKALFREILIKRR